MKKSSKRNFLILVLGQILLCILCFTSLYAKSKKLDYYLIIDKAKNLLYLKKGERTVATYKVATGIKSKLFKEKRGDFLTPEGIYKIVEARPSKSFEFFYLLDYPNTNDVFWAYFKGRIKSFNRKEVLKVLGDGIGIHGGGSFRKGFHWTKGCIALKHLDLLSLKPFLFKGEQVFIIDSQKSLYEILKKLVNPVQVVPCKIFKGELYLKSDPVTYYHFVIKESFSGEKRLIVEKFVRGDRKFRITSFADGRFCSRLRFLEESFKRMLLENLNRIEF